MIRPLAGLMLAVSGLLPAAWASGPFEARQLSSDRLRIELGPLAYTTRVDATGNTLVRVEGHGGLARFGPYVQRHMALLSVPLETICRSTPWCVGETLGANPRGRVPGKSEKRDGGSGTKAGPNLGVRPVAHTTEPERVLPMPGVVKRLTTA